MPTHEAPYYEEEALYKAREASAIKALEEAERLLIEAEAEKTETDRARHLKYLAGDWISLASTAMRIQ